MFPKALSCSPKLGCERPFVEPFVQHLNALYSTDYVYVACLDRDQLSAQPLAKPEMLFESLHSGQTLVVERKSVVWPEDYVYYHHHWHHVAEAIHREIGGLLQDAPYRLHLQERIQLKQKEIANAVGELGALVRRHIERVRSGDRIVRRTPFRWALEREADNWRDIGEPKTGIGIETWPDRYRDVFDKEVIDEVARQMARLLEQCNRKFEAFPDAKRVLLLEPYGEAYLPLCWALNSGDLDYGGLDEIWIASWNPDRPSESGNSWIYAWEYERQHPQKESSDQTPTEMEEEAA